MLVASRQLTPSAVTRAELRAKGKSSSSMSSSLFPGPLPNHAAHCWEEQTRVRCVPRLFLLGVAKSGACDVRGMVTIQDASSTATHCLSLLLFPSPHTHAGTQATRQISAHTHKGTRAEVHRHRDAQALKRKAQCYQCTGYNVRGYQVLYGHS